MTISSATTITSRELAIDGDRPWALLIVGHIATSPGLPCVVPDRADAA